MYRESINKLKHRPVYAQNGMIATSQPLAAQAGLDILKKGGNAVDAAIATAACLTVVEPTSNGIGSDAFALVWIKDKLHGLNASGWSPKNISIEKLKAQGLKEIPKYGMIPITIPGTPKAWAALSKKFGKLSLRECLEPAIAYAEKGFPVSQVVSYYWNRATDIYKEKLEGDVFKEWFNVFTKNKMAPKEGETWFLPDHATTLKTIGDTYAEDFYKGILADKMVKHSTKHKGYLSIDDFTEYEVEWVDPISVNYRGYDIWEIPPNGQGLITLMALKMLEGDQLKDENSLDETHLKIEALKSAFSDGMKGITDPVDMNHKTKDYLDPRYLKSRRALIKDKAKIPAPGTPPKGGTVYLATADNEGNMVSYIQSNYMGFGSGVVVPGTGIALQNRGHNFSFDPNHVNSLKPRKRPYHTIIPGFITHKKIAVGPFGVMGGFMQPQGHLQVISNLIDYHCNPQQALDQPRWQWLKNNDIIVEEHMSKDIIEGLKQKGHIVKIEPISGAFGRGQIIWYDKKNNVYIGGTESRADGSIASW
jgi:gamma-glutamyltranspeptidase/glutathione hydrolase